MKFIIKDICTIIFRYKHELEMRDIFDEMDEYYLQRYDPPFSYLGLTVFRPYNPRYSGARQINSDFYDYIQPYLILISDTEESESGTDSDPYEYSESDESDN